MGPARSGIKYSEAVDVTLAPSRLAAAIVLLAGFLTLVLIAATPVGRVWQAGLAFLVAAGTFEAVLRVAWHRGPFAATGLLLDSQGALQVRDARGRWRSGRVRSGAFVAPWLTIVRWRTDGGWLDRTVLVLPDMLPAEPYRRLRVWLRMS